MTEFYIPFVMERNQSEGVEYRLRVRQSTDIAEKITTFEMLFQYRNQGAEAKLESGTLKLYLDGKKFAERSRSKETLSVTGGEWEEVPNYKHYYYGYRAEKAHNASGGGTFTITAELAADPLLYYNRTKGAAEYSGNLEQIDLSFPTIEDFKLSVDRYGLNAYASFKACHCSYSITYVRFLLMGITLKQANARRGKVTQADRSAVIDHNAETGLCTLELTIKKGIESNSEIYFDLDAVVEGNEPLTSGAKLEYYLEIGVETNYRRNISGDYIIPQKVEMITCEDTLELCPGDTHEFFYSVLPTNAEEQRVYFASSDENVAIISPDGVITALAEGGSVITATTADGGFEAVCALTVIDTTVFPTLSRIDVLSARDVSKIDFACGFIRDELIAGGADVPELQSIQFQGRAHPVKQIKSMLEKIEANCQLLKAAAPVETSLLSEPQTLSKQNENWWIVVNSWIDFLNEIHSKINGG